MPKIVDHQDRRREISAIAADLIARGGMEAATIREIARSSGYSKGVIEHYFDGKEELISGALDWINQRYERRVEKATAGLSGVDALRKRIEATLPVTTSIRDEWKVRMVFWGVAATRESLGARQARRFEKAVEFYASDIAVGIEEGDIATDGDVLALAQELFTSTLGISTVALYTPSLCDKASLPGNIEKLIERLSGGFRAGIQQ